MYQKIHWTEHAKLKMKQYGLSKAKLLALLAKPERVERGIAEDTTAAMRTNNIFSKSKAKRSPGEVWLMYQDKRGFRSVISAWRYPGTTKPGEPIPIPEDIRREIQNQKSQAPNNTK